MSKEKQTPASGEGGQGGHVARPLRHPMVRRISMTPCLLIVLALVSGCEPQVYGTILDHDGERAYLPGTGLPFTGVADVYYEETDRIYLRTPYANGFLDGFAQRWHLNGQLASERTYKNGKMVGLDTWWYENGQKRWEIWYENDKQHGHARYWNEDGTRQPDICWRHGKRVAMNQCDS